MVVPHRPGAHRPCARAALPAVPLPRPQTPPPADPPASPPAPADAKTAIETVQADVKELATVKSPADFFKLQGEILRRNFDAAVASGSKHSEAMVKLANEAFAPVSTRVSLAVEKVKQAA